MASEYLVNYNVALWLQISAQKLSSVFVLCDWGVFLFKPLWLWVHCYADCCLSVPLLSVTQLIIHCHIVPTNNGSVFTVCSTEIWFTDQWARWFCLPHNEPWWDCDKLKVEQWQPGVFYFTRFLFFFFFFLGLICKNKNVCSQSAVSNTTDPLSVSVAGCSWPQPVNSAFFPSWSADS